MLRQRVITALVLAACLLGVLFALPPNVAILIWGLVVVLGAWEWAAFGGLRAVWARATYAACIGILLWLAWREGVHPQLRTDLYLLACLWWALALLWLSLAPGFSRPWLVLVCGVLTLVPCFVAIADVHATQGALRGPWVVLWLLVWVFSADIGAYFAGRAFGRLKLAPRISPAKTWEGVIGGVLLAMVTGSAGAWIFDVPMGPAICFAIALAGLSIVGDLTESFFKRIAGLKDSGGLLPGHGGVLDRIDSVTAAAPLFALALSIYEGMH